MSRPDGEPGIRRKFEPSVRLGGSDDTGMLADLGAGPARSLGKGRAYQTRIGLPVGLRQGRADHSGPEPGILGGEPVAADQLERQIMFGRNPGIGLQLRHIGLAPRELQMAARLELAIRADDVGEAKPKLARAPGERQLRRVAALLAHAAEIDAARLAAAGTLL